MSWSWKFLFSFFWKEFILTQQSHPVKKASLQWEGWLGGLLQNCFGPPTCVDTASVILAGGLRNPGFLCICGTKGSHVAYGKPLHLRLPHLLQEGDVSSPGETCFVPAERTNPACWGSHKHCLCLVLEAGDLALHLSCMLLPLLLLQWTPHFIHKIILNV